MLMRKSSGLFFLTTLFVLGSLLHSRAQSVVFSGTDLLQGQKKVSIPFRFIHNFIILDVRIYGTLPIHLIYDTGAEHIILFKREYTDLLGAQYDKRIPVIGSDLSRQIYALITRNAIIELQGLPGTPYDLLVLEEDYFNLDEIVGTAIDGLIGGGFFRNLVINIDYRNQRLNLYDPAHFEIPKGFMVVPVRIKTNKPYVDGEASLQDGTVVSVDLLVDTGAGVPLLLHNNSHPSLKLPEHHIRGKLGMGLGGYLEGYIGRINKLSVGDFEFFGVLTSFQDIKEEWLVDQDRFRNGILGNQMLSRFSVYFDYNRGQMMIKPYSTRQKPFLMDRSGMVIFAYGVEFDQYVIKDILPNSPALEVGLQAEDIIVKIQGFPSHLYTLDGINHILQKKVGKKIRLVIRRKGEKLRKEFRLRDLV